MVDLHLRKPEAPIGQGTGTGGGGAGSPLQESQAFLAIKAINSTAGRHHRL